MMYCFSATGNSRHMADKLGALLGEKVQDITHETRLDLSGRVILVCPCYYWGVPDMVRALLKKTPFPAGFPVHFVVTCGGFLGTTDHLVQSLVRPAKALCSQVRMQTNYILRYRVDTGERLARRLRGAEETLPGIAAAIREGRGLYKSSPLLRPLASKMYSLYDKGRNTQPFYATDACTSCGLCAQSCPDKAITMNQGRPRWDKPQCQLCLKCLHRCPASAIEYGEATRGKARYTYPNEKIPSR